MRRARNGVLERADPPSAPSSIGPRLPMGTGGSMDHEAMHLPAITLQPGQTKEVTVTFERAGTILYACHVPGHYAASMVGALTVT